MSELFNAEAGFDEMFTINYRRYAPAVIRFLKRFVYDRCISEEICQDVFLKVYEKKIRLDPESPQTLSFFFTAAKNMAIDYLRRLRVEEEKLRSLRIKDAVMDRRFYEDIENMCLRGEVISTLSEVINAFPEDMRALVAARCLEGRSAASVARDSGTSPYHVRKIEKEAHRRIRDSLGLYFEVCGAENMLDRKKYAK